jgi:hypothetical protein
MQDAFSPASWWWQFRELIEMVKGDEIGNKYNERQFLFMSGIFGITLYRWIKEWVSFLSNLSCSLQ